MWANIGWAKIGSGVGLLVSAKIGSGVGHSLPVLTCPYLDR